MPGLRADPLVLDALVMFQRRIKRRVELERLSREAADGGEQIIGRDDARILTLNERDARVHQHQLRL